MQLLHKWPWSSLNRGPPYIYISLNGLSICGQYSLVVMLTLLSKLSGCEFQSSQKWFQITNFVHSAKCPNLNIQIQERLPSPNQVWFGPICFIYNTTFYPKRLNKFSQTWGVLVFLDKPNEQQKLNILRFTGLYAEGGTPVIVQVPLMLVGSGVKVCFQCFPILDIS